MASKQPEVPVKATQTVCLKRLENLRKLGLESSDWCEPYDKMFVDVKTGKMCPYVDNRYLLVQTDIHGYQAAETCPTLEETSITIETFLFVDGDGENRTVDVYDLDLGVQVRYEKAIRMLPPEK